MADTMDRFPEIYRDGISVLYGSQTSVVDIVFVHGLNGSPGNTWRGRNPPQTDFYWPWELRSELRDARVMTFGYNADIKPGLDTNITRIVGIARSLLSQLVNERQEPQEQDRPLIFVGHSLGGLVIKMALVQAAKALITRVDDHDKIYNSTKGLMFFGVPNAGSMADQKKRSRFAEAVASMASTEVPPQLREALRIHSPDTTDLADDFRRLSLCTEKQLTIYSFYEERTTAWLSEVIVDEHSARVGYDIESVQPINQDHEGIVKFKDRSDGGYRNVVGKLKQLRRKACENGIPTTGDNQISTPVPGPVAAAVAERPNQLAAATSRLQITAGNPLPPLDSEEQTSLNFQLAKAAEEGKLDLIKSLHSQGGQLDSSDGPSWAPSPLSAATQCYKVVARGRDPERTNNSQAKFAMVVQYLVDNGVNPQTVSPELRLVVREIYSKLATAGG